MLCFAASDCLIFVNLFTEKAENLTQKGAGAEFPDYQTAQNWAPFVSPGFTLSRGKK